MPLTLEMSKKYFDLYQKMRKTVMDQYVSYSYENGTHACECGDDYCRCSTIINAVIHDSNLMSIQSNLRNKYVSEFVTATPNYDVDLAITWMDKIIHAAGIDSADSYKAIVCGGYYGQEINGTEYNFDDQAVMDVLSLSKVPVTAEPSTLDRFLLPWKEKILATHKWENPAQKMLFEHDYGRTVAPEKRLEILHNTDTNYPRTFVGFDLRELPVSNLRHNLRQADLQSAYTKEYAFVDVLVAYKQPIALIDQNGNILDGQHRIAYAQKHWKGYVIVVIQVKSKLI